MITSPDEINEMLQVEHFFMGGLYAKKMSIPRDARVGKHVHDFTHTSVLASGRVIVTVDDVPTTYAGKAYIEIAAGKVHTIEALEDSVWFCIHATDETDPDKIDEELTA